MTPRGVRNANPLNIEAGISWQGLAKPHEMTEAQKAEDRFAVFRSPEWGIRAAVRILQTYRTKYGLNTVSGIIGRWAPSHENDTSSYAHAVARGVGVQPDQPIDTADEAVLVKLVGAMIRHENGVQPYDEAVIRSGIALAGLGSKAEPEPKPVAKSKRVKGAVVAGGAGAVTLLAQASDVLRSARGIIAEFTGLDPVIWPGIAWVLGLGFAAFVVYVLWTVYVDYRDEREPEEVV